MADSLTLGLLPERRRDWRTFAASYGVTTIFILLLLSLRLIFPDRLQFTETHVTELIPLPAWQPEPVKIEPRSLAPIIPHPAPVIPPKIVVPKEVIAQPKPAPAPPQIEAEFKAPLLQPARSSSPRLVYTGAFGSSKPETSSAPAQQVQTGGFGDPNGLPGSGKDNAHLSAATVGSFNGAGQGGSGGAKALQRVIASAGFDAQIIAHGARSLQADAGPPTTLVEIISKPNPVYTEEARKLRLEGEVLLEVMFGADGHLRVDRVVRGLGHGLDEAAIAAANKIQFKPALRNGSPVDSSAIVHVTFQLAY
jgi:TonB family protein